MSDIVYCNVNDMEQNGIKVLFDEETILVGFDFSEHDKVFKNKIAKLEKKNKDLESCFTQREQDSTDMIMKLKRRIAELESKESVKPMRIEFHADNGEMLTPLEVANSLINKDVFKVDELKELAEHLQVYCRHHNDRDTETISF